MMSGPYYATPYDAHRLRSDKVVYSKNDIVITEWQDRLWMVKDEKKVAELINGRDGLKKYHKDSFEVWINNIRKKDLKKAKKMIADAERIMEDADAIEELWSK